MDSNNSNSINPTLLPSIGAGYRPTDSIMIANRSTRGIAKAMTVPTTHIPTPTSALAARARVESAQLAASVSRSAKKKALFNGLNYEQCGKPDRRLRHATKNAHRFATTSRRVNIRSGRFVYIPGSENMGKSDFTSVNPNNLPSVAGRSTSNESSRVLPKLIIPSNASLLSPKYYDAHDYFFDGPPETPVAPHAWHTPIAAESDCTNNGCLNKSLAGLHEGIATPVPLAPASPTAKINYGPNRGSSKVVASLATHEHTPTSPAATSAPRSAKTKALLIGLNYRQSDRPLRHATGDAHRFTTTLTKLGYSSENIKVVTDEPGQPFASQEYLLECIDWLVQDVSEGEEIFFVFSGHCDPSGISKPEPYLVAGDLKAISQSTFQARLVTKVPAGAELTIVLDYCHAASMVKLKYCIGRMERAEAGKPLIPIPQRGPLQGLSAANQTPPPPPLQVGPAIAWPAGSGTLITLRRNLGSVIGARSFSPAVAPSPAAAPFLLPVNFPPSIDRRRGRQLVVEGHPVWQFEERTRDFVSPADLLGWRWERQKAFEASGDVKNGIVTDAICSVLDTSSCPDKTITLRDVWRSVVGAVGKENSLCRECDSKKDCANIPTSKRWQGAQLWVSQEEPLSSSSPTLDLALLRVDPKIVLGLPIKSVVWSNSSSLRC